ncbi:MAG: hypothetical protein KIS67_28490 [Verrucomicrobiae bacterium]|nr:hypothetical protein [Verrucomicrobiae bacterium]
MKNHLVRTLIGCASAALLFSGCGQKTDADSELERAARALQEADPAPQAGAATAPVTTPVYVPSGTTAQPAQAQPAPPPAEQMSEAMTAYKSGNLEDAVTRLQRLRATPAMTPQQRMALNDAMAAVMTEIYSLAAKGDARAIQAVKQYEAMQSQQRR